MKKHGLVWRRTAIAAAVSVSLFAGLAQAQTNATGTAYGTVQAAPGTTVVLENTATGFKRTLVPDSTGRFTATALPTGTYKGTLMLNGQAVGTTDPFQVSLGQGSEVFFAAAASQVVTVTGKANRLDMSSSNNGVTFTATQLAQLPIQQNLDAIIQLAPNTTRVDSRYTGGASFGGGAASENSYYINGYPITNPLTQLGSSELPFGAISQAQVQTGGFGVEFGRSIGGVVNIISKSGTNKWEAGLGVSYAPDSLRAARKNRYYENTGANPSTDGKLYSARSASEIDEVTGSAYIGGPLIADKLFLFAAVEEKKRDSGLATGFGGTATNINNAKLNGWSDRTDTTTRYLAKLDWNLTNDHRLELTMLGDKYVREEALSGFDYNTLKHNNLVTTRQKFTNSSDNNLGVGADVQILKYTGYLTNDLTFQALVGRSKTPHPQALGNYDPNMPEVFVEGEGAYPGFTYNNLQTQSGNLPSGTFKDETKGYRFDLEYRLGKHSLRAGLDSVKLTSLNAGEAQAGGRLLVYSATEDGTYQDNGMTGPLSASGALRNGTFYYYGTETKFSTVNSAFSDQNAWYLEDKYQATKDLLLTFGVRNEQYKNKTADGQVFLKVKDQLTPRFAFAWDANGDASTKIFGSAGRYAVQLPTSVALRGANPSLFTNQVFTYTGIAADGTPTGRVDLGPPNSTNNEYGQPKDLKGVSAQDMKPNLQDELTLGIERAMSRELNVGARVTYRRMTSSLDDFCDPRPFVKYANDNGITDANGNAFGAYDDAGELKYRAPPFACATFNPGVANTFLIDYKGDGNYSKVKLSSQELGFEKAKRTYMALDLFAEHPFQDGWYGRVNFTFSKNKGNTEGQTNSDLGQGDIAATVTWDHSELMVGSNGNLPNDRPIQIKAYGFVQATSELQIGANLLLASGRPKSCLGPYPNGDDVFDSFVGYSNVYHYCFGKVVPRGSAGSMPWEQRLDMNFVYRPNWAKGLALRADVFNVINNQVAESVVERNQNTNGSVAATAGRVLSYTPERSVKLTATYDYKF